MSYEEAFEALKNLDYSAAVPLLEKAARETDYSSDIINHAYTLALYHTGEKSRLGEVAFQIAISILQHDPASAMDYFQRALYAGLDAQRVRHIGQIFEAWAVAPGELPPGEAIDRVAHVAGRLRPDDPGTQYLKMLIPSLKLQSIASVIFTTESAASWFFNPARVPESQNVEMNAEIKIASVEGDFIERAGRIAQAIRESGIHVAFFHGNLDEQITARVAALHPAPIQINVNRETEMDADLFQGRIHLFRNSLERSRFSQRAEWIPPASDIESRLQLSEPVTRHSMGLESASTVSATFGNLYKVAGREYLRVLSEIMKRFPKHFHIFAGAGNVRAMRPHLHSEGVLPRIRFLGDVTDIAPLLGVIDVYFASFPHSSSRSILQAMGAGRPVVVLKFPSDSQYNCGAELVGVRELIAPGEVDYIDIADRLLRVPAFRAAQGKAMLDRFRAEFRPERLGERYKLFIERLSGN